MLEPNKDPERKKKRKKKKENKENGGRGWRKWQQIQLKARRCEKHPDVMAGVGRCRASSRRSASDSLWWMHHGPRSRITVDLFKAMKCTEP